MNLSRINNADLRTIGPKELPQSNTLTEASQDFSKELEYIKTEKESLNQLQKSVSDSYESLDRMIDAEKGNSITHEKIIHEMIRVGDPYEVNPWVRKCVDLIANSVAALDYEFTDGKGKKLPPDHEAVKLFDYINEEDTKTEFVGDIIKGLLRFGKSFVLVSDDLADVMLNKLPQRLVALIPDRVAPQQVLGQLLYWKYMPGVAGLQGKPFVIFQPDQLLFMKYKHPYIPFEGISPVYSMYQEILLYFYSMAYNIQNLKNGAQGKGFFYDPNGRGLTPTQANEIQRQMDQKFNTGVEGAGKGAIINRDLRWQTTSQNNRDLEYSVMIDKARDTICSGLGTPRILLSSADATFANLNEAKKVFWTQTCLPIAHLIEDNFNSNFFAKFHLDIKMRFKIENIKELQEDINVQIKSYTDLVKNGGMPPSVAAKVTGIPLERNDNGEYIGWQGWDLPILPNMTSAIGPAKPPAVEEKPVAEPKKQIDLKVLYKTFLQEQKKEEIRKINKDPILQKEYSRKHIQYILEDERKIKNIIKEYFKDYWKQIEKHLKTLNIKTFDNVVTKDLIDPHVIESVKTFIRGLQFDNHKLFAQLSPQIQNTFFEGAYKTYDSLGIADSFKRRDSLVNTFLNERKAVLQDIPGDLKTNLIDYLNSEEMQGKNFISKLSRHYDDQIEYRMKRVARTETTSAYNSGVQTTMEDLKAAGMVSRKQWIFTDDDATRDSHKLSPELGEGIVGVDEEFGNGLLFPGDLAGAPEEVINCRCTQIVYFEPGENPDLSNSTFIV